MKEAFGCIWRHLGASEETSGDIREPSGSHLEASDSICEASGVIWSHLEALRRHPRDSQEAEEAPRRHLEARDSLEAKMCLNICVVLPKVARPSISHERGEGDPHDLRTCQQKLTVTRLRSDPLL